VGTFLFAQGRIRPLGASVVSVVDGAAALNQAYEGDGERLSEEEVQAIVRRYGERQGGDTRATVADVAEALQVEPSVVAKLLHEVRAADSERELRERLDRLEQENETLRRRAEDSEQYDFYPAMYWSRRRWRSRRPRVILAAGLAAMVAIGLSVSGTGRTPFPFWTLLALGLGAFVIIRTLRRFS
jgi:hypothetical protein